MSVLADAALAMEGTAFRLHGRDPKTGVDCVGLIACALKAAGHDPVPPEGYEMRNLAIARLLRAVEGNRLNPREGTIRAGDIVLYALGSSQYHLAIAVDAARLVHAHAGLGKVVTGPAEPEWRRVAAWHLPETIED